jgi:hypothetical protein
LGGVSAVAEVLQHLGPQAGRQPQKRSQQQKAKAKVRARRGPTNARTEVDSHMNLKPPPKILSADRTHDGVVVEFDDGNAALYSASLLIEVLPKALKLEDPSPDDLDEPEPDDE